MIFRPHSTAHLAQLSRRIDPFVKAFIVSDALLYSSLNFVTPLFALFVTKDVAGGSIEVAAYALTTNFVARIVTELLCSPAIGRLRELQKVLAAIAGMLAVSLAYIGFAVATAPWQIIVAWVVVGIAWGISYPAKLSIFSAHLDKDKATVEWGLTDILNMTLIAGTTALGGLVASHLGFRVLFYLAAATNLLGALPYYVYVTRRRRSRS